MRDQVEPDRAAIEQYTRGLLRLSEGRLAEAARELDGLQERHDALGHVARVCYGAAQRGLSVEAVRAGELERAEEHLRRAMSAAGRDCSLPAWMAELYARSGRREDCLREMDKAIATGSGAAEARRRLAQAQWHAGRHEEAYMTLTDALRRFGGAGALHLQLGLFLAAEERYGEARASFARAAEADCDNPDAHRYLALCAMAEGDFAAAARSFQRALDLRPGDLLLGQQLLMAAQAAADSGTALTVRLPEASKLPAGSGLAQLAEYVAVEPDFADALLSLPPDEADWELPALLAGVLELAIASRPGFADLHLLASRAFQRLGQIDAAIRRAGGALSLNGRFAAARLQLAELYARTGRAEEAVGQMERAIADGADWPDVHLRVGELLRHCGRGERARRHFERALQLNGRYAAAADALASLAA
jgi:tetratricopeptide (TPR) repeat protein